MLERLPPRASATAAAERALRAAIVSGELRAGDKLPPERELSARFGVSRLTLRAALATLSAAGLVTVRHGSGYTVRDLRESGGADLLPGLVELATTRRALTAAAADLLRLRRHLAAAVLDALAERPPAAAARRPIARASDRFAEAASGGDLDTLVDADLGVIAALLDATGSTILRVCMNPVIGVLRSSAALREAIYAEPATNLLGWRALAAWLEHPRVELVPQLVAVLAGHDRATLSRLAARRRGKAPR